MRERILQLKNKGYRSVAITSILIMENAMNDIKGNYLYKLKIVEKEMKRT